MASRRALAAGWLAAILAAGTWGANLAAGQDTQAASQAAQVLGVRIIDAKTKQPLAEVAVEAQFTGADPREQPSSHELTDEQGRCKFEVPDVPLSAYRLFTKKNGYVGTRVYWGGGQKPPLMPQEYVLALEPAVPVGGVVVNDRGEPIEGVTVAFYYFPQGDQQVRPRISNYTVKTDKDGRWRCDILPGSFEEELRIFLRHKDYMSDHWTAGVIPMPKHPLPPLKELQALAGKHVMKKGIALEGLVLDAEGNPLAGARVFLGEGTRETPAARSDEQGHFVFPNAEPGNFDLTVTAKGCAPQMTKVAVGPGLKPLRIQMQKGRTIRARVMDKAGRPVTGAYVGVEDWRGSRGLEWNTRTDAEGRFSWTEAPAEAVKFYISKQGYMELRNASLAPSDDEQVVTMLSPLKVSGKVLDAATGQPVEKFQAVGGIDWGRGNSVSWERSRGKPAFSSGAYEITFTMPYPGHLVRIEAEGYKPAVSRPIADDEGEVTVDFKLEKGAALSGTLLGLDGKPLAGAKVLLCTPGEGAYFQNGQDRTRQSPSATTDDEGKFSFPPQTEVYTLVAATKEGYVEVREKDFSPGGQVKLQPWGRIEGKVLVGSKPLAGAEISGWSAEPGEQREPRIYHDLRAQADKDGKFALDCVPPGQWGVSRSKSMNMGGGRSTQLYVQTARVTVEAGKTAGVVLGGTGRPVVGQIVRPPELADVPLQGDTASIRSKRNMPNPPLPADFATMDLQAKREWQEKWLKSDEGKAYMKAAQEAQKDQKYFTVAVEPDGSFRAEDVTAGTYELYASLVSPGDNPRPAVLGTLQHEFIVPEMAGGRSDEPLDLGKLAAKAAPDAAAQPAQGPAAPATQPAAKLVGKAMPKLEELGLKPAAELAGGKRIVLCLFDSSQRPSRQVALSLAKAAEQLAGKGAAVVLVHAGEARQGKDWLVASKITLPCGQVPADKVEKTLAEWSAARLPWIVLTDAKHVVQAEGIDLADLDGQLDNATSKPSAGERP